MPTGCATSWGVHSGRAFRLRPRAVSLRAMWCYKRRWMLTLSLALAAVAWSPAAFRGVWWPATITLVAAALCAIGTIRLRSARRDPFGTRLALVAALVSLSAPIGAGALGWAAGFSPMVLLLAVAAVPAFAFAAVALLRPDLVYERRHPSTYLAYAALASALFVLATGVDVVWLGGGTF